MGALSFHLDVFLHVIKQKTLILCYKCWVANSSTNNENIKRIEEKCKETTRKVEDYCQEIEGIATSHSPRHITVVLDDTTAWPIYKIKFDAAAKLNNWNGLVKVVHLVLTLRGSTLELLQTISIRDQQNCSALVIALETKYG